MRAPETAVPGKATARLTFDAWPEGKIKPTTITLDVRVGKPGPKLEAVSARLKKELVHPNRQTSLHGPYFTPDGKRIIACDWRGGTLMVWDAATGKQVAQVDIGLGAVGRLDAFYLSDDRQTVYIEDNKTQHEMLEQDGKNAIRRTYTGRIRAWDVATGKVRAVYQHDPPRVTFSLRLSPDQRKLLAMEELPGISTGQPARATTLWDVQTGQATSLPTYAGWGIFSPDSRTLAYAERDKNNLTPALKLLDLTTGQEKLSIPIAQEFPDTNLLGFSPDGKTLIGSVRNYRAIRSSDWEVTLKLWDVATGREVLSVPGVSWSDFNSLVFTPNGRLCALTSYARGNPEGKLYLIDLEKRQLGKMILLGSAPANQRMSVHSPVFSPDGKWLAVLTQVGPDRPIRGLEPEDMPQPRLHLIDVATGEIRETLIAPPGSISQTCFSPDGKTLAVSDRGKVLLWDMSQPPGNGASKK